MVDGYHPNRIGWHFLVLFFTIVSGLDEYRSSFDPLCPDQYHDFVDSCGLFQTFYDETEVLNDDWEFGADLIGVSVAFPDQILPAIALAHKIKAKRTRILCLFWRQYLHPYP